jgi:hypothetical protein
VRGRIVSRGYRPVCTHSVALAKGAFSITTRSLACVRRKSDIRRPDVGSWQDGRRESDGRPDVGSWPDGRRESDGRPDNGSWPDGRRESDGRPDAGIDDAYCGRLQRASAACW